MTPVGVLTNAATHSDAQGSLFGKNIENGDDLWHCKTSRKLFAKPVYLILWSNDVQ